MADPMNGEQYTQLCEAKQGEGHWIKPIPDGYGLRLVHSARKGQVWVFLAEQFGRAHAHYLKMSEAGWSILQLRTAKDVFAGPVPLEADPDKRDHLLLSIRWHLEECAGLHNIDAAAA